MPPCLRRSKTGVINFTELREWMTGSLRRKAQARNIHIMWARNDGLTLKTMKWKPRTIRRELVCMLQRASLAPIDLVRAWNQEQEGKDLTFSQREFLVMMKHIVYSDTISVESTTKTLGNDAEKAKSPNGMKANITERRLTALGSLEKLSKKSESDAREEWAAVKLQAAIRGRQVRVRNRGMSKEEGDKLWYGTIKPIVQRVFDDVSGGDNTMDIKKFVQWLNAEWRAQKKIAKGIKVPSYGDESDEESERAQQGNECAEERKLEKPLEEQQSEVRDTSSNTPIQKTSSQTPKVEDIDTSATPLRGSIAKNEVHDDKFFSSYCIELQRKGHLGQLDLDAIYSGTILSGALRQSSSPGPRKKLSAALAASRAACSSFASEASVASMPSLSHSPAKVGKEWVTSPSACRSASVHGGSNFMSQQSGILPASVERARGHPHGVHGASNFADMFKGPTPAPLFAPKERGGPETGSLMRFRPQTASSSGSHPMAPAEVQIAGRGVGKAAEPTVPRLMPHLSHNDQAAASPRTDAIRRSVQHLASSVSCHLDILVNLIQPSGTQSESFSDERPRVFIKQCVFVEHQQEFCSNSASAAAHGAHPHGQLPLERTPVWHLPLFMRPSYISLTTAEERAMHGQLLLKLAQSKSTVEVSWRPNRDRPGVALSCVFVDRLGCLSTITSALASQNINILGLHAFSTDTGLGLDKLEVDSFNHTAMKTLIACMSTIDESRHASSESMPGMLAGHRIVVGCSATLQCVRSCPSYISSTTAQERTTHARLLLRLAERKSMIELSWHPHDDRPGVALSCVFVDRVGSLATITTALTSHGINILVVHAFSTETGIGIDKLELDNFNETAMKTLLACLGTMNKSSRAGRASSESME